MGRGSDDAGNVQLLEALMFIALLLIPLVVLTQHPGAMSGSWGRQSEVAHSLQELLAYYEAAPDPDGVHASYLDKMVGEALQGNTTLLDTRVPRGLPRLADFNVFVANGQDLHRLRWTGTPGGEAVSSSRLWSPGWSPILAAPQVSLLDGQRAALRLEMVPLHGSLGLHEQPGLRAEFTLQLPDLSTVDVGAFAPLRNGTSALPAVTLSLLDPSGAQAWVVEPLAGNATLFFGVRESAGREVPAGTRLEVRLPPGFGDVNLSSDFNPPNHWSNLTFTGSQQLGWVLTADLNATFSGAQRQLMVNATRPPDARFHLLEARLDGGRLGQLQGLFVDVGSATASAALPPGRGPFVSLPGAAPWDVDAPAAVVLAYPDDAARTLTVTRFTLRGEGGATITAATGGASPATGAWSFASGQLEWAGSEPPEPLGNDTALEFRFTLKAVAPADTDAAGHVGLRADLGNDFTPWSWQQRQAGVWAARIGPNTTALGYDTVAGAHAAALNTTHRGDALEGSAAYETVAYDVIAATASDLARGLDESWLAVDTPRVPLGGSATVRWDLDRLVEEVVGQASPEWQFANEAPAVSLRVHHPAPAAEGEVGALAWAVDGLAANGTEALDVPAAALLGTHVVELRADFRLIGPGAVEDTQTVRLLGSFDVHRPGGEPVARPLYDVVLQAWMPDWG